MRILSVNLNFLPGHVFSPQINIISFKSFLILRHLVSFNEIKKFLFTSTASLPLHAFLRVSLVAGLLDGCGLICSSSSEKYANL